MEINMNNFFLIKTKKNKVRSSKLLRQTEAGFSLVEIIVASAIISLSLVSIIQIAGQSLVFSRQSTNVYVAGTSLEEGVEAMRTIRDSGWGNISSLTSGTNYYLIFNNTTNTWALSNVATSTGVYTRTVTVAPAYRDTSYNLTTTPGTLDTNSKLVTVTVSWFESTGQITKKLSFYLSNIFS